MPIEIARSNQVLYNKLKNIIQANRVKRPIRNGNSNNGSNSNSGSRMSH